VKKITETFEEIKEHFEDIKRKLHGEDPEESFMHEFAGDFYEEIPYPLFNLFGIDEDGIFLVHAHDGPVIIPFYWRNNETYDTNERVIGVSRIRKLTPIDTEELSEIEKALGRKQKVLQEMIKTQRIRKLMEGEKR